MDQFALQKLGNVTIEKIPAKASEDDNISDAAEEPSPNSPCTIQLPKLPPSINITIKPNPSPTVGESLDGNVKIDDESEEAYSDPYQAPSSTCPQNETKDAEDASSNLSSPCEPSSEICDNLTESKNNVNSENNEPIDCQELSEPLDDEFKETDRPTTPVGEDEKMDSVEEKESVDKEYEEEPQLPEIKEELVEYGETESAMCTEDLPEVPVNESTEGELPESVICKEEFSEGDSTSEEADDELDETQGQTDDAGVTKRKKKRKTKSEGSTDSVDESSNGSKKQKTTSEKTDDEEKEKESSSSELKVGNLRRNIREVMDETKLDEATLSAQMQEKERLRRVQEQLRANRDIQRQMMQAKVLSLIETGATSISSRDAEESSDVEEQKPNTVVVKLSSGSGPQKMLDLLKKQKTSSDSEDDDASLDKFASLSRNLSKPQMMTSSVSIAPVKHEPKMVEIKHETYEEELMESVEDDMPKNKDIVMISSSSSSPSSDDDDCIVISEDEESEPEEDTGNSGMHTNDLYNVPDEQGRVLINVGHRETEKDVFLAPQIARIIKPHQIGGVRFLFDNIVESLDRFSSSEGFGCILAHSMGLGKTLQVVSFCDVFLRYTEARSVLCIMPINTLQNWVAEFNMWLPVDPETSPLKEQGDILARHFPLFVLNDNQKSLSARANVIQNWYKDGGVLLIGYELYRQLCLKKSPKVRLRSKKKEVEEDVDDEKSKSLLETMYNALVKPGPDLVICDEGHRIKNSHASISHALKQIRSKRRVVLTGYPLQNNLLEYWCMVDFVRPNYLGTKTEFSNMFERPIQNGQCIDSTPEDVRLMRYRAHVLHSLLEGFVQRRSHRVLQETLPQKYEFVILLKLTSFQKKLYNTFMNEVVRTKAVPNPLKAFAVCCKIWNHPDILHYFLKKRAGEEDIDLDLEETVPNIGTAAFDSSAPMTPSTPPHLLANKRGRTRGKAKDKPPRKNARTSTPQPINKPPSMAPIPPNTASNPKPPNPEHAITNANNQPIPPFNSYNNQFQNFNQPSNENTNFGQSSAAAASTENFGNGQFSQQSEYSSSQTGAEYNNANFQQQQNYNEGGGGGGNYYQSEYEQPSNYWPGANNDEGNFYNSNSNTSASSAADNFYPSSSSSSSSSTHSTTQSYSNEFASGQGESSQSDYSNPNFSYQPMPPFSREFAAAKQPDMGGMRSYGNSSSVDSGMARDASSMYSNDVSRGDMNFGGQSAGVEHFAGQNAPADGVYDPVASRGMYAGNMTAAEQNAFNSFTPPPVPKTRRGRPPSQSPRAIANRQKRNANRLNAAGGHPSGTFPPLFKPGLLGGAPLKTGSQSYAAEQASMQPAAHLYARNDMNQNYQQMPMQGMGGEGLWNAPPTTNPVFGQNYGMYGEMPAASNSNFIANDAPPMMGEGRGPRNLLNDIQPNEIFNPREGGYPASAADSSLFNLNNFNYLNDIPLSGHTSFMGLLEGVDSMEMGQGGNAATPAAQGNCSDNAGYMEPGLQYQASSNANPGTAASNKDTPYSETVGLGDSAMPSREVNDSLMGLTRKGQITLKKVEKKETFQPAEKSEPEFAQSRLPAMDMFSGAAASANFAASGSATPESGSFSQPSGQYGFGKSQSASTSSTTTLSTQTSWDSYGSYSNEYGAQGMVDKQQNFGNFGAAANSPANKSKAIPPFERASNRMATQTDNYDNGTPVREAVAKDQLPCQTSNSSVMANVTPKVEDGMSRNYYQAANNGTEIEPSKNVFAANVAASAVKVEKKLVPPKQNPQILSPSEIFKTDCVKSEPEDGSKMGPPETPVTKNIKEEPGIPYDWAIDFFKDYDPGKIEASAKTLVFFCMLDEIIRLGDRLLLFSQSLFTLDLLEDFLNLLNIPNTEEKWARNKNYFRLDGSTSALEREKLINEFNQNPSIHLFLVSTRAGSLGINLVGANRVVVFDASWNPCHDTQAVCRVYRYGQQKPCYVYRFVMDNCLEKKIYDRQINKQGLSDRIVDECNPDANLTIKDVTNLCWDDVDLTESGKDFHEFIDKCEDVVMKKVIEECGSVLSREPFQHESLLVDRADKKLSSYEKRQAKKSYEEEKKANLIKPVYGLYTPVNMQNRMKPTCSVRPMPVNQNNQRETGRRFLSAEFWRKEGLIAKEMTLPYDIVMNNLILRTGDTVLVLKGAKGIYMQLETGKIISIKTSENGDDAEAADKTDAGTQSQSPNSPLATIIQTQPPVDRTLAALSNRRDVTVSPIPQRYPRPLTNMAIPNMTSRPQNLNRNLPRIIQQPVPRVFPQSSRSPQVRSPSRVVTSASSLQSQPQRKQMFGPNSAVTISVANQKNMESQIRGTMGADQIASRGINSRALKEEYSRNYEKEGASHLTEVAYDDYSGPLREPMPRSMNEARKAANQMTEFPKASPIESGYGSRIPYSHPSARDIRNASQFRLGNLRNPPSRSDALAESLRYKKDINLTPVKNAPPKMASVDKPPMLGASKAKLPANVPYQQQQHHQQHQQQHSQPYQMSPASKMNAPKPLAGHGIIRGRQQPMSMADMPKPKKEPPSTAPAKSVELPKSSAISIFPVAKKSGEEGAGGTPQASTPFQQQDRLSYQSNYGSSTYPSKQSAQFGGSYAGNESSQFAHQYDSYKPSYQPGFGGQSEYQQPQQSFSNAQYPPPPAYSAEGFASGGYASEGSSQYSSPSLYSNQSSSQSSYDQYGSYYNYGQKNDSLQQPSRPPPPTQSTSQ